MRSISFFALLLISSILRSQSVERVEPPFWWANMADSQLQLMLYGEKLGTMTADIKSGGIKITQQTSLDNPNYLFLDLELKKAKAGVHTIHLSNGEAIEYEIKQRKDGSANVVSFDPSDVLYLVTPDRFANGNPENDTVEGLLETADRYNKGGRHGGDIKGIRDHLDYIKNLGFTAIWLNPVLENNMETYSYHGYSTTDFYKVDARFGTNEEYRIMIEEANAMGIKVIMDMIVNHCGLNHWWKDDLPSHDWYNYQKEYLVDGIYQETTHRKTVIQDPHASKTDLREFTDGWFVPTMPDLNQKNPFMATYLIQNSIWWIEYSGVNGIRMDTYPYPDMEFMSKWTCRVKKEFPNFNTVGEEWNTDPAIVSYWQDGKNNKNGYTSCLPSLMDFPIQSALKNALTDNEETYRGWVSLYETLAKDFLYADPTNLVVFPDNHDMSRFYTQMNEDFELFKLGIAYILTTRGIPQIYYGTEVLMKNPGTEDHGIIRSDFPGGWPNDPVNAFSGKSLSPRQAETTEMFRKILNWRKTNKAVQYGKLTHFNPKQRVYVYFRHDANDTVMVVLNKDPFPVELDLSRFGSYIKEGKSGTDIVSGRKIQLDKTLSVPGKSPMIIDFD